MRTSMAYPIRFWALLLGCLLIYQFSADVSADWCKFEKDIDLTLDLSTSELLAVSAAAGDLDIIGVSGSDKAVIRGKACASTEEKLDQSGVSTTPGRRAQIFVNLPDLEGGWSLFGKSSYAWLDLNIEVPQELALEIKDSSGDITLKNIAAVQLQDSSGDIKIENARGSISIRDTSGDIDIEKAEGDLTIEADSSGDIDASNINGTVLIIRDSSGDIRVSHVRDDVIVERDSSGDISARDVGGDFRVLKDGSGSISSQDIAGEVVLPQKG